jgi:hypothetical protein
LKNRYYIVEPDKIVADDLAHAIRVHDPAAEVIIFHQPDAVLDVLDEQPPKAVLLKHDPRGFRRSKVGLALKDLGIPYAFSGLLNEADAEGAEVLATPFSENSVANILRRMEPED